MLNILDFINLYFIFNLVINLFYQLIFIFHYLFYSIFNLFFSIIFGHKTFFIFDLIYSFILNQKLKLSRKNEFNVNYISGYFNTSGLDFKVKTINQESTNSLRYVRFSNPVFKYDYKSGDYFPKLNKELYFYLFSTISDLTSAVRPSP
jgi:hypothetical protein